MESGFPDIKALLISISVILSSAFLSNAWISSHTRPKVVSVTGSARRDFSSDLMVWQANVSRFSKNLREANQALSKDVEKIKQFLKKNNIKESEYNFTPIQIKREYDIRYNENGLQVSNTFLGFTVSQRLTLETKNIETAERMISKIGELINEGMEFDAQNPDYFYTQLSNLKIQLLEEATKDAKNRAEIIAKNAGSKLYKLKNASMGVFQITAQNSNENYDWGGTFNTESKNKTISITVKLEYEL